MTNKASVTKRPALLKKLFSNPVGVISGTILALFVAWAFAPQAFTSYDPNFADFANMGTGPSFTHILGTDNIGRDIFARVVWASRYSLAPVALSFVVTLVFGTLLGLASGYYGGLWEQIGNWFSNIVMTLPIMVVLLAAVAITGPNMYLLMTIFGVLLIPMFFRIVSLMTRSIKQELFVDAARVFGLGDGRIMLRHILPLVRGPILVQAGFLMSVGIAMQSGLQFLGVGDSSQPSWGEMLSSAYKRVTVNPGGLVIPVIVLGLIMSALILFSNAVRDALQVQGQIKVKKKSSFKAGSAVNSGAPIIEHSIQEQGQALLEVKGLAIGYPAANGETNIVVSNSTFNLSRGEVVGLVGESGSGKTQTALALLGLLPQGGKIIAGTAKFEGNDIGSLSEQQLDQVRGRRIAYIPQEPMSGLDATFTIGSQLMEPMRVRLGLSKKAARERVLGLLSKVGMPNPLKTFNSYPHEISGGQAQRVLIAGALSLDPALIIADEPTTALDVTVQAEILDLLRVLQRESGVSVLLVTHNFGVVADICDRVVVMQTGRVIETGSAEEVFRSAEHVYTRELLGAILDESTPARADYKNPVTGLPEAEPIISVRDLEVTYHGKRKTGQGFKALQGVSIDIRPGETVGLVGESGSGKTTLGRAVLGLAPVSSGSILFEGKEISHASRVTRKELARSLQVVFQDPYTSLNPTMKISELLAEPLTIQGTPKAEAMARVRELLDAVALPSDSLDRFAREFSGGQRQRIAIARALALQPKVIVCDEPVSALDLSTSAKVLDLFLEIQQRTGVAYLFISHDLAVVRHVSHRVAVMRHGEIVEWGEGSQVTSDPQHEYTKRLLMAAPVADPRLQAERRLLRLESSSIPA